MFCAFNFNEETQAHMHDLFPSWDDIARSRATCWPWCFQVETTLWVGRQAGIYRDHCDPHTYLITFIYNSIYMISTAHNAGTSSRFNITESIGLPWPCLVFFLGGKFLAFDPTQVSFRNAWSQVKGPVFLHRKTTGRGLLSLFACTLRRSHPEVSGAGDSFWSIALGDGGGIRSPYAHHMSPYSHKCQWVHCGLGTEPPGGKEILQVATTKEEPLGCTGCIWHTDIQHAVVWDDLTSRFIWQDQGNPWKSHILGPTLRISGGLKLSLGWRGTHTLLLLSGP